MASIGPENRVTSRVRSRSAAISAPRSSSTALPPPVDTITGSTGADTAMTTRATRSASSNFTERTRAFGPCFTLIGAGAGAARTGCGAGCRRDAAAALALRRGRRRRWAASLAARSAAVRAASAVARAARRGPGVARGPLGGETGARRAWRRRRSLVELARAGRCGPRPGGRPVRRRGRSGAGLGGGVLVGAVAAWRPSAALDGARPAGAWARARASGRRCGGAAPGLGILRLAIGGDAPGLGILGSRSAATRRLGILGAAVGGQPLAWASNIARPGVALSRGRSARDLLELALGLGRVADQLGQAALLRSRLARARAAAPRKVPSSAWRCRARRPGG
jgi:hypothetical protein